MKKPHDQGPTTDRIVEKSKCAHQVDRLPEINLVVVFESFNAASE
jgi:hypothetical protein